MDELPANNLAVKLSCQEGRRQLARYAQNQLLVLLEQRLLSYQRNHLAKALVEIVLRKRLVQLVVVQVYEIDWSIWYWNRDLHWLHVTFMISSLLRSIFSFAPHLGHFV